MTTNALAIVQVVDGQLVKGEEFLLALADLKSKCSGIVVADTSSCTEAKELVKRGRDEMKAISAAAEPERLALQNRLTELRNQRDKMMKEFEDVITPLDSAARKFDIAEQEAAAAEQAKINKGKPAEKRVEVKPDIAPVAGTRFQVRYKVEVIDASEVKRKFLCPDEVAIRKQARDDQDPAKTMKTVGGIVVTKE